MYLNLCLRCKKRPTKFDLCMLCFRAQVKKDYWAHPYTRFEENLKGKVHTVYIMFYGVKGTKIGYTENLFGRILEHRREYPENELVYFREFVKESDARMYEVWLKKLKPRPLHTLIMDFQNKLAFLITLSSVAKDRDKRMASS